MRSVLMTIEFTAISNDAADELIRLSEAFLGETPPPNGLLSYRVVRHGEHTTRVVLVEEWTDVSLQEAFVARSTFTELARRIRPLVAEAGRSNTYDVLAAGPRAATNA